MLNVISFGEAIVDLISDRQTCDLKSAEGFRRMPGGAPANVAVGIARLGGKVSFLGKFGADSMGTFLLETLQSEGVNTTGCIRDEIAKTMLALVWLKEGGEREFEFYGEPGAHNALRWDEIPSSFLKTKSIFHFGSLTLIHNSMRGLCLKALAVARENDFLISFDPNIRLSLWRDEEAARQMILEILPMVDILKLSAEELDFLSGGQSVDDMGAFLLQQGLKALFVTDGIEGSKVFYGAEYSEMPAFRVQVVDTTGAGDGFTAGILRGISHWGSLEPLASPHCRELLLQLANRVASLAITSRGAMASLPRADLIPEIAQLDDI